MTGWGESEAGVEEAGRFVNVAAVDDLAETNVWLVEGDLFSNNIGYMRARISGGSKSSSEVSMVLSSAILHRDDVLVKNTVFVLDCVQEQRFHLSSFDLGRSERTAESLWISIRQLLSGSKHLVILSAELREPWYWEPF